METATPKRKWVRRYIRVRATCMACFHQIAEEVGRSPSRGLLRNRDVLLSLGWRYEWRDLGGGAVRVWYCPQCAERGVPGASLAVDADREVLHGCADVPGDV